MNKKYFFSGIVSVALLGTMVNGYSEDTTAGKTQTKAQKVSYDFAKNGYKGWKAGTVETSVAHKDEAGKATLIFKVIVDYTKDGKGNADGKYLKGWPRVYHYFKPVIELGKYKEFSFDYKITTTNKTAEKNPIYAYFNSDKTAITMPFDAGKEDGEWHNKVITIADIIKRSKKSADDWQQLTMMNFGLSERNYPDKTTITIEIKNLRLQ
jgi:hypothetical protein